MNTEIFKDGIKDFLKLVPEFKQWWTLLPQLIIAGIILGLFFLLGKVFKKITYLILLKVFSRPSLSNILSSIIFIFFLFLGILLVLDILNLDKTISSIVAGAGVVGLILGFAFQDMSANIISGVYMALHKPFEVGDHIETSGYKGIVEMMELRSCTIRTFTGLHIIIPNKQIFQGPFTNYSLTLERRVDLDFKLAINDKTVYITEIIKSAVVQCSHVNKSKAIEVYFTEFFEGSLKIVVWFWIQNNSGAGYMEARHSAITSIISNLNAAGVEIL